MKIRIIQTGKNKDNFINEATDKFLKLLSPYSKINLENLKECRASSTFSVEKCKKTEADAILNNINEDEIIIPLDEKGKNLSSLEFANEIKKYSNVGKTITFIVGGPFGLHESVKTNAHLVLSLSKMTFTHQMTRIILLEQIYRAVCIIRGKEYHIA